MTLMNNKALISCGILKKEINYLISKNQWNVNPTFLHSGLHTNFDKLWNTLSKSIDKHQSQETLVCYGSCHPLMHKLMEKTNSKRTLVQNCVDLILGKAKFNEELEKGAFFLFEDWALNWDKIAPPIIGKNPLHIKELYSSEHNYLLCIETPCSNDFSIYANEISEITGLPVKWLKTDLKQLENNLKELILN